MKLTQGYAFAGLLADAMEQTANKKGMEWSSDQSGSVVLTQALHTLSIKGSLFKGQNHIVGMYMPPTDPKPALAAAKQLGMKPRKDMAMGNGTARPCINAMLTNAGRARDKSDDYNWEDYAGDLASGAMTMSGAAGVLFLGASTVVSSPALTTMGVITGAIGAAHFAGRTVLQWLKR